MSVETMTYLLLIAAVIPPAGNLLAYTLRVAGYPRAAAFIEGAIPLALSTMHAATKKDGEK